eukprot:1148270-Pelagomonas_calceolata.AAC.3
MATACSVAKLGATWPLLAQLPQPAKSELHGRRLSCRTAERQGHVFTWLPGQPAGKHQCKQATHPMPGQQ